MKGPKTFTREDVVEVNCHGGIVAVNRVFGLLSGEGCRFADTGEFTKRGLLKGRRDLPKAETVADLIR